jgi:DNA-binding transcriptional LysR family regulator
MIVPASPGRYECCGGDSEVTPLTSNGKKRGVHNGLVMPSFSMRTLELLRVVIETRSVTATAERLHVSQPAVSKAVKQAEDRLGFPLFLRERGRLVPTLDARVLLPEIVRAVTAVDQVSRLAEDLRCLKTGTVSLAATPVLGNTLAARAIARFHTTHPGVQITIETMFNHEVVEAVADHRVDLGLVLTPVEDSHTVARDICTAALVCIMPRDHPLACHKVIGPSDAASFPLISFSRHQPIGALIEDAFRAASIRRVIAIEVTQSWTACVLVQSGAGIAVMDGFTLLGGIPDGLAVRPFEPAARIAGRLLRSVDRPASRHAEAFVLALLSVVQAEIAMGQIRDAE